MVSARPPTSKFSSPFSNPLVSVPKSLITIGIIVTFVFHSFFLFPCKVEVLIILFTFFQFYSVVKSTILQILFFCCWLSLGLVFWPRLGDPCICQSPIGVYMCHFQGQVLGCAYTICSYGRIWIVCTSPSGSPRPSSRVYSYIVLYSFCVVIIIISIFIIIIIIIIDLFTPVLTGGLSFDSKWQQVFSVL